MLLSKKRKIFPEFIFPFCKFRFNFGNDDPHTGSLNVKIFLFQRTLPQITWSMGRNTGQS